MCNAMLTVMLTVTCSPHYWLGGAGRQENRGKVGGLMDICIIIDTVPG